MEKTLERKLFKRYRKMLFFLFLIWGLALVNFITFFITTYFLGLSIWVVYEYYVIHVFTISKFVYWFVIGFVSRFLRKYIKKKYYYPELERLYKTSPDYNKDFFLRLFYVRPKLKYIDESMVRPIMYYFSDVLDDIHSAYIKVSQVIHAFYIRFIYAFYLKVIYAFYLRVIKPHLSEDLLKDKRPKYNSYFSDNLTKYKDPEDEYQSIFSEVLVQKEIEPEVYQEFYQSITDPLQRFLFWNFTFIGFSFWFYANRDDFTLDLYFDFLDTSYLLLGYAILYTFYVHSSFLFFKYFLKDFLKFIFFEVGCFLFTCYYKFSEFLRPKVEWCLIQVFFYPYCFYKYVYDKILLFFKDCRTDLNTCGTMLHYYYSDFSDNLVALRDLLKYKFLDPILNHKLYPYFIFCITVPISAVVFEFIFRVLIRIFF